MPKLSKNKMICITGTFGAGKSSVSKLLKEWDYAVLDLDDVVRELYTIPEIILSVNQLLFQKEDLNLNIAEVSQVIFENEQLKQRLEQYLYPKVYEKMIEFSHKNSLVFIEMALVFEKGWNHYFDEIVCVVAKQEIITKRLQIYRGYSLNQIEKRLQFQLDAEFKMQHSDYIIENSGDEIQLVERLKQYLIERGLYERI